MRVGQRELRISKAARIQLAIIAGLYLLVQGASLWLDRYKTLTETSDRITGASYVDVHAVIPGLTILSIAAAIVSHGAPSSAGSRLPWTACRPPSRSIASVS